MTAFRAVRNDRQAKSFEQVCGKNRAFQRSRRHRRRQEKALVELRQDTQGRARLLAQSRRGQTTGRVLHAVLSSRNIAADGSKSAARILDQGAHAHIRSHIRRLDPLHEFAVAVVHHTDHVRTDALDKGNQFSDGGNGKGGPGLIALGALDGDQLRFFIQRAADALIIKASVRKQVHLPVADPVFLQRTCGLPDADHLLQRIIRLSNRRKQLIPRPQV